jgi:hypothetical protein
VATGNSFTSANGSWDVAGNWSGGAVPAANTPVTIGSNTTLITVGGTSDTAAYIKADGATAGGAGNTMDVTGTLSLRGGTKNSITNFNLSVASGGVLNTDQILFTGSSVEISGLETFSGGGSTFASSTVIVEAGGRLNGDALALSNTTEYLYGQETLSNGGGGVMSHSTLVIETGGTMVTTELNGTSTDQLIVYGSLELTGGGPGANMSNTIGPGGVVTVDGYEDAGTSWLINGGTFASAVAYEKGTFNFTGTGGLLDLLGDSTNNSSIKVTGFSQTDAIILGSITGTGAITTTIVNGNTLELIQDGKIVGAIDSFTLAPGTSISQITGTIANGHYVVNHCFYPGTRLATAEGEIEVEHVRPGTMLKTASGEILPVRWVGWSEISTRFADPLRSLPIRIKADALADGVPARDLLVSPDHAVFVGGVLVQAGALVNGASILRESDVPESFRYYHVELATHELLLAENCPAESFVDNVDRMNFHNWDAREAPVEPVTEMDFARAKSARQVPVAVRNAVAGRAGLLAPRVA